MSIIPFIALYPHSEWLTSTEFHALIKPRLGYSIHQNGKIIVRHPHSILCHVEATQQGEKI
jgi:hypothetical protein